MKSLSARELAKLGNELRLAQRKYFRIRTPEALEESKRIEREFDEACKTILTQPSLPLE